MFYGIASPDWTFGRPMTPAGALLFRSPAEAEAFAPDAHVVAVDVRFDEARRAVRPRDAGGMSVAWSARAVANALGGVTVFGVIPPELVRPARAVAEGGGVGGLASGPEFGGWDTLTMALLA